jgi:hypothetical protein
MDMKNNKLVIILALIFFITACDKDEAVIDTIDLGTEFFISGSYTSLDDVATFEIDNPKSNLSSIVVTALGGTEADGETDWDPPVVDLGTITVSGGMGSLTVTSAELGMTEVGATGSFQFASSYNGKNITRFFDLEVDNPISTHDPGVQHRNDTIYYFTFEIEPVSATVETVTVQTKLGELGTYVDLPGPFNAVDSIPVDGYLYNVGDTLFVNVIGTNGAKVAETETPVIILPVMLTGHASFKLNSAPDNAYDLVAGVYVDAATVGEEADIEFVGAYTTNGLEIGFASYQNAEFVPGTEADFIEADSLTVLNVNYNNAITMNGNVSAGEVYFYRTNRGATEYFGVMKITKVDKPQGILEDSVIEFEYRY